MHLTNTTVRYSTKITERVQQILTAGCSCGAESATLTKRLISHYVTIHLQCDTCGRSISGALPRDEFYNWQDYPEWNLTRHDEYYSAENREVRSAEATLEWQNRRLAARSERSRQYHQWLLTSPEWWALRQRVMTRAARHCEACLAAYATEVHHETYALGRLPPAFLLRAVCAACHERLHDGWFDDVEG